MNDTGIKCATVAFICVVLGSLGSCQATRYQVRKMVDAGHTPIEAACAYQVGMIDNLTLCAAGMMRKSQ